MIERRQLGATSVEVSRLALGGHEYLADGRSRGFNEDMARAVSPGFIGEGYGGPRRKAVLQRAYDLGINFFDVTIDSEKEALGRNLRELPPPYDIVVQTRPEGMCYSYDENNAKMLDLALLRAEVQRGLRLIGREVVDFYNFGLLAWSTGHDPDYLQKLAHNIAELKRDGLIRFAVADSFSGEALYLDMIASGAFDVVNTDLSFGDYAAIYRVMPEARRRRLGILAREVFFKSELFVIGAKAGITDRGALARAALQWVAAENPDVVLLGVDQPDYLDANAEAFVTPMSEESRALLAKVRTSDAFKAFEAKKLAEFGSSERV